MNGSSKTRLIVGWWCPSMPDGPLIPPRAFTDPCGKDRAVYDDGTMDPPPENGS